MIAGVSLPAGLCSFHSLYWVMRFIGLNGLVLNMYLNIRTTPVWRRFLRASNLPISDSINIHISLAGTIPRTLACCLLYNAAYHEPSLNSY